MVEDEDEEPVKRKEFKIFGKDLLRVPCLPRSTFYGVCGGITTGFIYFMATSRIRNVSNMTFAGFWVGFFGYWIQCRHKYENNRLIYEEFFKSQFEIIRDEE